MKLSLGTLGTEERPVLTLTPESEAEVDQLERLLKNCHFELAHEQSRQWDIYGLTLFLEKAGKSR